MIRCVSTHVSSQAKEADDGAVDDGKGVTKALRERDRTCEAVGDWR